LPKTLTPAAVIALSDPVRSSARDTLAYFEREGVTVKVISGDNPLTVSLVAKEAGLKDYQNYIDMSQITTPEQTAAAAVKYRIFGRASPSQKKELIAALKAAGHTVAMTGDGVNDLPALREADCGIALAAGSKAAGQAADLVLTESDFSVLPAIVAEGRRVLNNVTRVGSVFFIKTIYSVLLSLICVAANIPFPFIPLEITLIDAAVEAYPAFFLSFEPDNTRVTKPFLPTVLKKALPCAFLITLSVLLAPPLAHLAGVPEADAGAAVYYLTGFISLAALFLSARPLNRFRLFLCSTAALGFFAAAFLFSGLLGLPPLSAASFTVFAIGGAASLLFLFPLGKLTDMLFKKE
jgi:cation-transporting ATPase E